MSPFFLLGGHRGLGCTDSAPAQLFAAHKPAENTLASIQEAFRQGADYVEIDVLSTRDGQLVVTHSNRLSEHVLHPTPKNFVGDLTLAEVQTLRVGRRGDGRIPTLIEVLDFIASLPAPAPGGFRLNIELKGVQGTPCPRAPSMVDAVAELMQHHGLGASVVFSSFALKDIADMHRHWPQARLGMLFDARGEPENPVYSKDPKRWDNTYLQFTPDNVSRICDTLPIEFVHPEAHSMDLSMFSTLEKHRLKVNTWTWLEVPPSKDPSLLAHAVKMAKQAPFPVSFLTDYLAETKKALS